MSLVICYLRRLSRVPGLILINTYKLCGIVCTGVELYCAPTIEWKRVMTGINAPYSSRKLDVLVSHLINYVE